MKRSAGLLLWRRAGGAEDGDGGAVQVLLAHPGGPFFARKDDAHWTIPKGEIDAGEDELAAALREFTEELGIPVPPGTPIPLGEAKQSSGKVNVIWALRGEPGLFEVRSNHFDLEWPPRSGRIEQFPEVDRAEWFSVEQARVKLFGAQREFLDRLLAALAQAPAATEARGRPSRNPCP